MMYLHLLHLFYIYLSIYLFYSIPFYSKFYSNSILISVYIYRERERVKAHNMAAGAVPSTGCRCRSTKPKHGIRVKSLWIDDHPLII
jgi:hypothetical protein